MNLRGASTEDLDNNIVDILFKFAQTLNEKLASPRPSPNPPVLCAMPCPSPISPTKGELDSGLTLQSQRPGGHCKSFFQCQNLDHYMHAHSGRYVMCESEILSTACLVKVIIAKI